MPVPRRAGGSEADSVLFNCDIATPMGSAGNTVFAVDLWIDVFVRGDGQTFCIGDEDEFGKANANSWLSDREVDGRVLD